MRTRVLAAAAVLVAAACRQTETPEQMQARMQAEADSVRATVEAAATAFAGHFTAGHADSMLAYYAENANLYPPNAAPVSGHEGIRGFLGGMLASGPVGTLTLRVTSVSANGPLAVVTGRWSMIPTAGSPVPADSGSYVEHWHQMAGQWKVVDDLWNSVVPMPAPPPSRGRR